MPDLPGDAAGIRSMEALAEALDFTPQQFEAVLRAANESKRRNAAVFLTAPRDGGTAPAYYIVDQIARGVDMDSEIGRGLLANFLNNCAWPDGGSHLEALGKSNRDSLDAACAALSESQAAQLRAIFPDGLSHLDTGLDAMGEAMCEVLRPSTFATWEDFTRAAGFTEAAERRLLDEFVILKEQLSTVLQAEPAEGGESPLDYQARLLAAGDPHAGAALDRYLGTRTNREFGLKYSEVLERANRERLIYIIERLEAADRGKMQRLWRQPVMALRLPGDRFDALLAGKIKECKGRLMIDHDQGMSPMPWSAFCRGLLLTSAQEQTLLAVLREMQAADTIDAALPAEARAREAVAAALSPAQLRRWGAFARRSLFTIQLAA